MATTTAMTSVTEMLSPEYLRDVLETIATDALVSAPGEQRNADVRKSNQSLLHVVEMSQHDEGTGLLLSEFNFPNSTFHSVHTLHAASAPDNTVEANTMVFTVARVADLMAPARLVLTDARVDISDRVTRVRVYDASLSVEFDSLRAARRFVIPMVAMGGASSLRLAVTVDDADVELAAPACHLEMHTYYVTGEIRRRVGEDRVLGRFRIWPLGDGRSVVTMGDQWRATPRTLNEIEAC